MREPKLSEVDMNLLVALDALLAERSVSRAATRVGLSQPAMSHALGRLRRLFDDPLLVRGPRSMLATTRAERLEGPLSSLLADTRTLLRPPDFLPDRAEDVFRIAMTDYCASLVMPLVVPLVRDQAPGIALEVGQWHASSREQLESAAVDLAVHPVETGPAALHRRRLFDETFSCLVCARHPIVGQPLTVQRYIDLPHALISVTGVGKGHVGERLEQLGLRRRVMLQISHFLAAPLCIARTDLILTLPTRLARSLARIADVAVLAPPAELALERFTFSLLWHERRLHDPAHAWLRALFGTAVAELPALR